MTTLPPPLPICLRVDGNWNVVNAPVTVAIEITDPELTFVPIRIIDAMVIDVRAVILLGLKIPPTVVNAGKLNEVRAATVLGLKLPPTVVNAGKLNEVRALMLEGLKLTLTVVKTGKLNEERADKPP